MALVAGVLLLRVGKPPGCEALAERQGAHPLRMRDINRLFVAVASVTLLGTTGPVLAGSSKGVCQAGGVNAAVLETAQVQYFEWYFGIRSPKAGRSSCR